MKAWWEREVIRPKTKAPSRRRDICPCLGQYAEGKLKRYKNCCGKRVKEVEDVSTTI